MLSESNEKPKNKSEDLLREAFHFDDGDLKANHKGLLSQRQMKSLSRQHMQRGYETVTGAGCAVVGLLMVLYGLWFFITSSRYFGHVDSMCLLMGIGGFLLLIGAGFTWNAILNRRNLETDMETGHGRSLEGHIVLYVHNQGRNGLLHKLKIRRAEFDITRQQFEVLCNNEPYRVYFAPATMKIVAIEEIHSGDSYFEQDMSG